MNRAKRGLLQGYLELDRWLFDLNWELCIRALVEKVGVSLTLDTWDRWLWRSYSLVMAVWCRICVLYRRLGEKDKTTNAHSLHHNILTIGLNSCNLLLLRSLLKWDDLGWFSARLEHHRREWDRLLDGGHRDILWRNTGILTFDLRGVHILATNLDGNRFFRWVERRRHGRRGCHRSAITFKPHTGRICNFSHERLILFDCLFPHPKTYEIENS